MSARQKNCRACALPPAIYVYVLLTPLAEEDRENGEAQQKRGGYTDRT